MAPANSRAVDTVQVTLATILTALANNPAAMAPEVLVTILMALDNNPVATGPANNPVDMVLDNRAVDRATLAMTATALANKAAAMVPDNRDMDRAAPAMIRTALVNKAVVVNKAVAMALLVNRATTNTKIKPAMIRTALVNRAVVMAELAPQTTRTDLGIKDKDTEVAKLDMEILRAVPLMTAMAADCNKEANKADTEVNRVANRAAMAGNRVANRVDTAVNKVVGMMITIE